MSEAEKPPIVYVLAKQHAPQLLPTLERHFECRPLAVTPDWAEKARPLGRGVRALVTGTMVGADAALLDALPELELVVVAGGHVDLVDEATMRGRGIRLTNTPNASAPDVADLAIALMLDAMRRITEADRFVRGGHWRQVGAPLFSRRLTGKRLGIVGLGAIGERVARRAEAFDMEVVYHGRAPKPAAPWRFYDDVLAMARDVDVLSLHCKLTPETRGLVDARVLAALGPDGILVNVARGDVVDHDALVAALKSGGIAGAGLDVFADEPHGADDLVDLDHVVLNPHHGAYTWEAKQTMIDLALANLQAFYAGHPLVTPAEPGHH